MSTPRRIVLWTLALLPFGAAVLAHVQGSAPTLSVTRPALPSLAFDQYLVDLGPIRPTAEVGANFIFRHRGTEPVRILDVKPSCGCLQPRLGSSQKLLEAGMMIAAGATDAVVVRVQPTRESPGRHEYTLDIKYADPEPRETRLTFRVDLPEKGISIKPPALMAFQFSDRETVQKIVITDTRGVSWRVLGTSVSLPSVTVSVGEPVQSESGAFEQTLEATVAAKVPAGRHRGSIIVFTDDATYPELKIPLVIAGREVVDDSDAGEQHSVP